LVETAEEPLKYLHILNQACFWRGRNIVSGKYVVCYLGVLLITSYGCTSTSYSIPKVHVPR
jgi:hypothetical protein